MGQTEGKTVRGIQFRSLFGPLNAAVTKTLYLWHLNGHCALYELWNIPREEFYSRTHRKFMLAHAEADSG